MRIATRLLLILVIAVTAIMGVYAAIALNQRAELARDALIRETETLARALQAVTDNALRDQRFGDLDRVLGEVAEDPETFLVAVLEPDGQVLSGSVPMLPECLPMESARPGVDGIRDWAECDGRVRWVSLEVQQPGRALVVARHATLVTADQAASRIRISITTLALAGGAALVILIVLNFTLSRPLKQIMGSVGSMGGEVLPDPIDLPRRAGELRELGNAFNDLVDRLERKRASLLREIDERIELQSRIRKEEKFAALGRLTGGLAHELGSPLNVIGVRAERILKLQDPSGEMHRHAAQIVAEVERVADLIRSLTHIARRGRVELRRLDLTELVVEVGETAEKLEGATFVRLLIEHPEEAAIVQGDRNLLRHALLNLLKNAVEAVSTAAAAPASPGADGGGGGERPQGTVWLRLGLSGDEARIEIEDDGPGVAEEDLAGLFEPFYTTKDVGDGMGLGLAIARGILEEHGGTLDASMRGSGGLRVTCVLPLVPADGAMA